MVEQLVIKFALEQLFVRFFVRLFLVEYESRDANEHNGDPCEHDGSHGI